MRNGECRIRTHGEGGVRFRGGPTRPVTSASSHYADKIREWEPTRHPTSNTSKREKERGERGRNCKHACNSARANQNVMSLRCDDEAGDSVRPPPEEEICVRVKKDAISLAILLPRSLGREGGTDGRAKPDKKPRSTTMLERPRVGWQRAIMSSRGMRTSG